MAADRDLVFVSFFVAAQSTAVKSCEAILTQLNPFQRSDPKFRLWHRGLIPAGSNKINAINAALGSSRTRADICSICSGSQST
jgi:hypothetical protein